MTDIAVTRQVERVELRAGATLAQAWRLYKRLFVRSVLMSVAIFGTIHLVQALAVHGRGTSLVLALLELVLVVAGTALLQGGLVEIVRGLHVDGDDDASVGEVLARAGGRLGKLVRVSLLSGLGVGLGMLLLLVPGVVLLVRWSVSVPVAMLEDGNARDALRRSREIVRGNGWNVFKVLLGVGVLTLLVTVPFTVAAGGSGPFAWWVGTTIGSALTAPYAAHAFTVVYYALVEPGRPVALEPGRRWQSVWDEQDAAPKPAAEESLWDEYERRFDERERRWGRPD